MPSNQSMRYSHAGRSAPLVPPKDAKDTEIFIAIMGATGSGKSTFMNLISGSNIFAVGNGLRSCTSQVEITETRIDGRAVVLIDTPGFDDTNISDANLLNMIALTLSAIYRQGHKLTAIIYMHRISDDRVGGTARRNLKMFHQFCGDENLKNVVIVTNMWSLVDKAIGEDRERELCDDPDLFQPVLAGGATMFRHDNTLESARAILQTAVSRPQCVLRIQRELVDEGKDIAATSAGQELDKELAALVEKQNAELEEIQADMISALAKKDKETEKELAGVIDGLMKEMEKVKNDRTRVSEYYQAQSKEVDDKIHLLTLSLKGQRSARKREAGEREMNHLQAEMARAHRGEERPGSSTIHARELRPQSVVRRAVDASVELVARGVNWVFNSAWVEPASIVGLSPSHGSDTQNRVPRGGVQYYQSQHTRSSHVEPHPSSVQRTRSSPSQYIQSPPVSAPLSQGRHTLSPQHRQSGSPQAGQNHQRRLQQQQDQPRGEQ